MTPLQMANGMFAVYDRQQATISKLLCGELPEGECEFCGTECQNFHSEGPDLQAKEIVREGGKDAQDSDDDHAREGT